MIDLGLNVSRPIRHVKKTGSNCQTVMKGTAGRNLLRSEVLKTSNALDDLSDRSRSTVAEQQRLIAGEWGSG